MTRARPIPDDFVTWAPGKSLGEIAAHYGVGTTTAARWRGLTGTAVAPRRGRATNGSFKPTPMPDGFALVAPSMTVKQLREHYGRSQQVIGRWLAEAGVEARRPLTMSAGQKPLAILSRAHHDITPAGQAADFLRRFGPVFRCTDTGKAKTAGHFWNRNGFVLTDDELIARARRLGWDPDAWRRLHAA